MATAEEGRAAFIKDRDETLQNRLKMAGGLVKAAFGATGAIPAEIANQVAYGVPKVASLLTGTDTSAEQKAYYDKPNQSFFAMKEGAKEFGGAAKKALVDTFGLQPRSGEVGSTEKPFVGKIVQTGTNPVNAVPPKQVTWNEIKQRYDGDLFSAIKDPEVSDEKFMRFADRNPGTGIEYKHKKGGGIVRIIPETLSMNARQASAYETKKRGDYYGALGGGSATEKAQAKKIDQMNKMIERGSPKDMDGSLDLYQGAYDLFERQNGILPDKDLEANIRESKGRAIELFKKENPEADINSPAAQQLIRKTAISLRGMKGQ